MKTGIGQRIKERRKELGLSQEELATKMGLKSKSTICKVETVGDNLTADTVKKYAEALDTTPAKLMGWDDTIKVDLSFQEKNMIELYRKSDTELKNMINRLLGGGFNDN